MTDLTPDIERVLSGLIAAWDDRTLDYAVSHIYSAWPENENLDRDAFLEELLWHIKHRDDRDDELAHLAEQIAALVEQREEAARREALLGAADDLDSLGRGCSPEYATWLRSRAGGES